MPTKKAKEKKPTTEDAIRRQRIQQVLPCELTKDELAEAAAKMAAAWAEANRVKDEFESVKSQFKSQTARCEADINLYSEQVRSKTVSRQVDCEVVIDYMAKTKSMVRLDTGKVLASRALTTEELQIGLKLNDKKAPEQTEEEKDAAINALPN